jgi:probable rRNA maturation factor
MTAPGDSTPSVSTVEPAPAEPEPPDRLAVAIVEEAGDWSSLPSAEEAIRTAAAALTRHPRFRGAPAAEACVVLGDDALLRSLNRTYRGKDAPTNVLSFPFHEPLGAGPSSTAGHGAAAEPRQLGDVVLAVETVRREAAEQGIEPVHHLQHLVVHGLLHLLGFDHETEAEAEAMEGLEVEILASLGIPDPYAAANAGEV